MVMLSIFYIFSSFFFFISRILGLSEARKSRPYVYSNNVSKNKQMTNQNDGEVFNPQE